jgi:hypothetical protein
MTEGSKFMSQYGRGFSPHYPGWLWDPFSFLSKGYQAVSLRVKQPKHKSDHSSTSAKVKKMSIQPLSMHLHGVMLNYLSTGTTLPFSQS